MSTDLPGKVPGASPTEPTKGIDPSGGQGQPSQSFETYMQSTEKKAPTQESVPSPFDLSQGKGRAMPPPTHDSVLDQMQVTKNHLETIQDQLGNKNLKLKQSQKYLLNNKLTEANTQIRTAASKTGLELPPPKKTANRSSVLGRYIGMIQDSQDQVDAAAKQIKTLKDKGSSMSAGDLLMIQVKLQKANTELEYTSVLLNSATTGIKTIFNIQI